MAGGAVQVQLEVRGEDALESDELLRDLLEELGSLDDVAVERRRADAPAGSKGSALGAAFVSAATTGALGIAMNVAVEWVRTRRRPCKLIVELADGVKAEIDNVTSVEEARTRLGQLGIGRT